MYFVNSEINLTNDMQKESNHTTDNESKYDLSK